MITLFTFQVPGDLEITREDLLRRGVPERLILDRNLRDCLRCAVADEPGWSASGPASGMTLARNGVPVGVATIEGEEISFSMHPGAAASLRGGEEELADLLGYWRSGVEYHRSALEGPAIRKVLDRMIAEVPDVGASLVPGLRWVPRANRPMITRIHELLPELPFWAVDVAEAPPGPVRGSE